jgi:uncharacterized metal-binding protein
MKKKALFVCFGGMSNVGTLTGLAGHEVARDGEGTIFCLASLACGDPAVRQKLEKVDRIVTVDDCPLAYSQRLVERAGFKPDRSLILSQDLGIVKGPPQEIKDEDRSRATAAIREALEGEDAGR